LGASLILSTEVCAACNAAFSPLDQDLVEHVEIFTRGRVTKLLGLGLQDDPTTGVRLSARLGLHGEERGLSVSPPQVFQLPDGSWQFRGGSTDVLATMIEEIGRPVAKVHETVDVSSDGLPVALAVVRTGPGAYVVRGAKAAEVRALAARLRAEGMRPTHLGAPAQWTPPERVQPISRGVEIPVGRISRAAAKVALNYVCSTLGAESALRTEFDPLRRFARDGEGAFLDFVSLALLDQYQREAVNVFAHPSRHALVLAEVHDGAQYQTGVQIVVFGQPFAVVRMGSAPYPMLPPRTWRVTYFDHEKKTFEHLRIPDDGPRCFVNIDSVVPGASALLSAAV
jgi:hypothetical protein